MDRKLGWLLQELDDLGLANKTAVVLHSDHGWSLGEQGEWRKFTNFDLSLRVPLIIRAPWLSQPTRSNPDVTPEHETSRILNPSYNLTLRPCLTRSSGLVELVDLAPTIADLAGISLPKGEVYEGKSLLPILKGLHSTYLNALHSPYLNALHSAYLNADNDKHRPQTNFFSFWKMKARVLKTQHLANIPGS